MTVPQIVIIVLLFIVGFVAGCFQIIAFKNCDKEKGNFLTISWIVKSDIFNDRGNRCRKLYVACMGLMTMLFVVFIMATAIEN